MGSMLLNYADSYYFVRLSALDISAAETLIAHATGSLPVLTGNAVCRAQLMRAGPFCGHLAVHPNIPASRVLGLVSKAAALPPATMLELMLKLAARKVGHDVPETSVPWHRVRSAMQSYGFLHEGRPTWRLAAAMLSNRLLARPRKNIPKHGTLFDAGPEVPVEAEALPEVELEYFACVPYRLGREFPELALTAPGLRKLVTTMLGFGESLDACMHALRIAVRATSPTLGLIGKSTEDVEKILLTLQEKV